MFPASRGSFVISNEKIDSQTREPLLTLMSECGGGDDDEEGTLVEIVTKSLIMFKNSSIVNERKR